MNRRTSLQSAVFVLALIMLMGSHAQCQAGDCSQSDGEVVIFLYQQILEREPDAEGLSVYKQRIQNGSYMVRDVIRDMISSQEHISRFMVGPSLDVCRNLYRHILGRQASEKECSYPMPFTNIELASWLIKTGEFEYRMFLLTHDGRE